MEGVKFDTPYVSTSAWLTQVLLWFAFVGLLTHIWMTLVMIRWASIWLQIRRAGALLDFIPCTSSSTSLPTSADIQRGNEGGHYNNNSGLESLGRDRRKRTSDHQLCNFIRNKRP